MNFKFVSQPRCMFLLTCLGLAGVGAACGNASDTRPGVTTTPPTFGPLATTDVPPPPISGGTMTLGADGHTVLIADSDRDLVYHVDIPSRTVTTIGLAPGDEPGRIAISTKSAWVALRGAGMLARINLATGRVAERMAVCRAPRGVAYDAKADSVYVACSDGDVVSFPGSGGPEKARFAVARDLRDVLVMQHGGLLVSRFRAGALLVNATTGESLPSSELGTNFSQSLAQLRDVATWRVASTTGPLSTLSRNDNPPDAGTTGTGTGTGSSTETTGPVAVGQLPSQQPVSINTGGYSNGGGTDPSCPHAIVTTTVTFSDGSVGLLPQAVLPVDVATNGREIAVVAAGNGHTKDLGQIFILADKGGTGGTAQFASCATARGVPLPGQAIAAVFDADDNLIVQSRQPAELYILTPDRARVWKTIPLADSSREDTGHAIFHSNSGGGLACASCHLEGSEDGHVWSFDSEGPRKTPSLLGTTANTAPYHWNGDMRDMGDIMAHVFEQRMSGPHVNDAELQTLTKWVDRLPAPKALAVSVAADRGKQTFESRQCASCHAGKMLTSNATVDVGTGGRFQVPSLIGVGWRTSLMHTGCANNLFTRFDDQCGGLRHGNTENMTPDETQDLIAYLRTL